MADSAPDVIKVEVVYALPHRQTVVALKVPQGTTVIHAIIESAIAAENPELDPYAAIVGINGRRVRKSALLHAQDRVEIYRPLIADPKQERRRRARKVAAGR